MRVFLRGSVGYKKTRTTSEGYCLVPPFFLSLFSVSTGLYTLSFDCSPER
jgi:hypothetical protein